MGSRDFYDNRDFYIIFTIDFHRHTPKTKDNNNLDENRFFENSVRI